MCASPLFATVLTASSGRGAADAVSRGQHAPHALKQGQGHQDVDDSEVAQVESLDDQAESNPGERGDRAERRNEIFGGKDDAKRLVMGRNEAGEGGDAENEDFGVEELKEEALGE